MSKRPGAETIVSTFPFSTNQSQSPWLSCSRPIAALGLLFVVLSLAAPNTFATSYSWTNTTGAVYTNIAPWSPTGGPPKSGDDAFITNYIGNTSITITNRGTGVAGARNVVTNSNLTIFNDAGTGVYTLQLSDTVFRVTGTTKIGTNAVVILGNNTAGGASAFSNNNLYVTGNGNIQFNGNGTLTALLVAGGFSNDVNTTINNINNNSAFLQFTSDTITVTNKGTMNFALNSGGGVGDTSMVVQVGSVGTGTFRNEGTFLTGNTTSTRSFVFSNKFTNAGTFVLTNGSTTASAFDLFSIVGSGLTNEATGTIKLTAVGSTGLRNAMTLNAGGFVNSGTLISDAQGSTSRSNGIFLAASQTFSNAAGGQIILDSAQSGQLTIWADQAVNVGTNSINSGTLNYRTSAGAASVLENPGTIVFGGANLNVDILTNTATGTIKATSGANAIVGSLLVNNGTIDVSGTTILSNAAVGATWTNSATGRVLLNAATLTGGQVHNLGTVNATGGLDIFRNAVGTTVTNDLGGTYVVGGAAMRFSTAFTESGSTNAFYNGGTFTFNAGTIALGGFVNTNTFNVAHSGTGTITAGAGYVFSNAANARVIVNSGTVVYASGGLDNLGVITAFGNGVFGNSGPDFTNTATGVIISTNSAATLGIRASAGSFVNLGSVVVSNGATINWLQSNGTGNTLTNSAGARLIIGSASSDGNFDSGAIANSGSIAGSGTINLAIGTGGRPLMNLDSGTLAVLDNRTLTVTNVGGTAFTQVVVVDVQTNTFNMYNSGTVIVGSGASELRVASGTNSAGNNFSVSLLNTGTVQMNGGSLNFSTPTASIVSNLGGWIKGAGTIAGAGIDNTGTILANSATPLNLTGPSLNNFASGVVTANSSRLVVNGVFTNSGVVNMISSVATFNNAVVNSGAWITDPTTNVFNNTFTVTGTGSIQASAGDVYVFKKDFVNQSTQSNTWNTLNVTPGSTADGTKFQFAGDGANTQQFFHAGLLLTGGFVGTTASTTDVQTVTAFTNVTGFDTNFAVGTLDLTNTTVELSQSFPGSQTNALFVNTLDIFGTSELIISNGMRVYFIYSNNWNIANVALVGDAEIHQLTLTAVVPEPSVLLLWVSGLATVYAARRRRMQKR